MRTAASGQCNIQLSRVKGPGTTDRLERMNHACSM